MAEPRPAFARSFAPLTELRTFVVRPRILRPSGLRSARDWKMLAALYALHVAVLMLVLQPLLLVLVTGLGLAPPTAFDRLPEGWLLPVTVLVAPVAEEILFRGWQSGRPRALWLLACFLAACGGLFLAGAGRPLLWLAICATFAVLGLAGWIILRRKPAPDVFAKAYPAIFWLVALGFAAVHLSNYDTFSLASPLLVMPQLWAGVMLGFTRQRLGLGAAILQHVAANGLVLGLAQLGT